MTTGKDRTWSKKLVLSLLFLTAPSVGYADWEDVLNKFRPRLSVQEEYTSNLNLTRENRKEDFITAIQPGLSFSSTENKEVKYGLDLEYLLGLNFYARNSDLNYVSHTGTLNTWYTLGRRLTLRITDVLLRSAEPEERVAAVQPQPGAYYLGTQRDRSVYLRNVLEPSLAYRFGPEDQASITYRHNYYENESPRIEDSQSHSLTPKIAYWFDIRNGLALEYGLHLGEFERSPDFTSHRAKGRYTYRFDPQTSVFAEYAYDALNYESSGVDFQVHNPSVGVSHAFTPTLNGRMQVGYFWRNAEMGKTIQGLSADIGLTQRLQKSTLDLTLQGGYTYDFFTAENLGFTRYYRGIGSFSHRLTERLSLSLLGTVEKNEFLDSNREDWLWRTGGDLSYRLMRWLTVSLGAYYRENNSDQDAFDYKEWRGAARLTAAYQ